MRVWCLGSGSRGNAIGIRYADTTLLIDAGFGPRSLKSRAAAVGFPLETLSAVILTHEHQDHVVGASRVAAEFGVPVYATRGTLSALTPDVDPVETVAVDSCARFNIGALSIDTCPVPHDAREPVALAVSDSIGARVAIAYDTGRVTDRLRRFLEHSTALVLEANHDEHMLRTGPYPPSVRARIAGPRGHLSNEAASAVLAAVAHRALEWTMLAHLSQHCNRRDVALRTVEEGARRAGFRGSLLAARQGRPHPPLAVGKPSQLSLALGA